ncbi:IS1634 family transposase [Myceligenerans halotolerans]
MRHFQDAYRVEKVTVVADAGMVSDANKKALDAAGLGFIIGARMPQMPYVIEDWKRRHPDVEFTDGQVFTQPWPAGPTDDRKDHWFYYQYSRDRARRTLRGIDEQVAKAEKALAGQGSVKRNRFVKLTGGTRSLNQALIDKARSLAGLKAYVTNLPPATADTGFVISAYHRLFQIEKSFRMAKSDLAARPIYARREDSIRAHLNIVLAAMAVARWIEDATGWSIRKFVTTARQHRTVTLNVDGTAITAENPLPDDLADAIDRIEERADEAINQPYSGSKTGHPVDNDPRD